jgi:hypothetical protein
MKDWSAFNVKYFAIPFTMLVFGMVIGFGLSESKKKPTKNYPIEVKLHWETDQGAGYPTMDADSVKRDTVYKDGNSIVVKNIINVQFK